MQHWIPWPVPWKGSVQHPTLTSLVLPSTLAWLSTSSTTNLEVPFFCHRGDLRETMTCTGCVGGAVAVDVVIARTNTRLALPSCVQPHTLMLHWSSYGCNCCIWRQEEEGAK